MLLLTQPGDPTRQHCVSIQAILSQIVADEDERHFDMNRVIKDHKRAGKKEHRRSKKPKVGLGALALSVFASMPMLRFVAHQVDTFLFATTQSSRCTTRSSWTPLTHASVPYLGTRTIQLIPRCPSSSACRAFWTFAMSMSPSRGSPWSDDMLLFPASLTINLRDHSRLCS